MNSLLDEIKRLKNTSISGIVKSRLDEFEEVGKSNSEKMFQELCFCILTANFNAKRAINMQKNIAEKFLSLSESEMATELKKLGHRFPNTRAKYIIEARKYLPEIDRLSCMEDRQAREHLVKNVKGLGYKEASHFLRNIGRKNLAIIDFHILDILDKNRLIKKPEKSMTRKLYFEIEHILENLAKKTGLSLAELDLYLWFLETGEILK